MKRTVLTLYLLSTAASLLQFAADSPSTSLPSLSSEKTNLKEIEIYLSNFLESWDYTSFVLQLTPPAFHTPAYSPEEKSFDTLVCWRGKRADTWYSWAATLLAGELGLGSSRRDWNRNAYLTLPKQTFTTPNNAVLYLDGREDCRHIVRRGPPEV